MTWKGRQWHGRQWGGMIVGERWTSEKKKINQHMHTTCAVVIVIKQVPIINSCFLPSHLVFHPYYTLPQGWLGVSLHWTLAFNASFTDFGISNNLLWLVLDLEPLTSGLRTIPSGIFVFLTELKSLLPASGSIHLLYHSILSVPSLISNSTTCLWIYLLYYNTDLIILPIF